MNTFKRIDIDSAILKINNNDFVIVDIRDKKSFEIEHINGAMNLSNSNINDFIINTQKEKSILVYCYHGNSSQSAAQYLVNNGFNDVYSLDGGYEVWKTQNNK